MYGNNIEDIGKTEPVGNMNGAFGFGAPDPNPGMSWGPGNMNATAPVDNGMNFSSFDRSFQPDSIEGTMPVVAAGISGFTPVVGWLVCVEGPDRGRDYAIRMGYNTIGRAPQNNISISGDQKISRERHAMIAFDDKECTFFVAPGNGMNLVRVNDKLLMMPTPVEAYDVVTIGSTKLMFVPFCSDKFSWNKPV